MERQRVELTEECSAILQHKLPPKRKDPGRFTILCVIENVQFDRCLCDLGASINLMHLSIFQKLGLSLYDPTPIVLQLADKSTTRAVGVVKDLLVRVGKFIFPADFILVDMEMDTNTPILLG